VVQGALPHMLTPEKGVSGTGTGLDGLAIGVGWVVVCLPAARASGRPHHTITRSSSIRHHEHGQTQHERTTFSQTEGHDCST
jgi:hypothetical protein